MEKRRLTGDGGPLCLGLTMWREMGYTIPMATISMFYGILIRMYLGVKEHNPPHFHAFYQGRKGIFDINTGEMTEGDIPPKQARAISVWASFHQDELLAVSC